MTITTEQIGTHIREARRLRGEMRQLDLALAIGKSQTAVAAYETGDILPPIDVLERIAQATGTSIHYLLYGEHKEELRALSGCILSKLVREAEMIGQVQSVEVTLRIDPHSL